VQAGKPYSTAETWATFPINLAETGMLPGGYNFIHIVFWTVTAMVAVGTNLMALALSAGLGLLVFEAIKKS
jgi:hypothetical protein